MTMRLRRWGAALRTPLGMTASVLLAIVLLFAVAGADAVGGPRVRVPHREHPAGAVVGALGRHRQPRPRHLLPHPGRHPPVGGAGAAVDAHRRGQRPAARRRTGTARAPGRPAGDGGRQHRRRVPRPAARAHLRGHLRRRRQGRGTGHRLRQRPRLRPADQHPDRLGRAARLHRRRADRRRRPDPGPGAAHAAEHRRAAGGQRDDRCRRRAARLRRPVLPGPGRAAARLRLGSDAQRGPQQHLHPPARRPRPRCRRGRRGARVQPVRRGDRQGHRAAYPGGGRWRPDPRRADPGAHRCVPADPGRRAGAGRRGAAGQLPDGRRRDHAGTRHQLLHPPRRGDRRRGRVRLRQEPHRPRHRAPHRAARPGPRRPARVPRRRPARRRPAARRSAPSAPRSRWCSRTR